MAEKEITNVVKLQIEAGKATPAPPVGPALGSTGINIMQFTKEFNEKTANQPGMIIPVVITVYKDKTFSFINSKIFSLIIILSLPPIFSNGHSIAISLSSYMIPESPSP